MRDIEGVSVSRIFFAPGGRDVGLRRLRHFDRRTAVPGRHLRRLGGCQRAVSIPPAQFCDELRSATVGFRPIPEESLDGCFVSKTAMSWHCGRSKVVASQRRCRLKPRASGIRSSVSGLWEAPRTIILQAGRKAKPFLRHRRARRIRGPAARFDTAVQYGSGESQKNLGRILQRLKPANGRRHQGARPRRWECRRSWSVWAGGPAIRNYCRYAHCPACIINTRGYDFREGQPQPKGMPL
jgi:hypothetical protein